MAAMMKKVAGATDSVVINAPNMRIVAVPIQGTGNYVSNAFSGEAEQQMKEEQEKGSQDKARGSKKKREPKDFEKGFRGSMHTSSEGWLGIPVIAFRASMVRAAQLCGIEMTKAKMCVFILADGYDSEGRGLIRITKGTPERFDAYVRNSNGTADIRARARVAPGWQAKVRIQFDADFLSPDSVVNLLHRAGVSVGVGAGRPFSTNSVGQGWGTWEIIQDADSTDKAAE